MAATTNRGRTSGNPQTQARRREEKQTRAQRRVRRRVAVSLGIAIVLLAGVAAMIFASNRNGRSLYDLSAVGNGVPAVVHVHDHACPVCRDLRTNVSRIENEFTDDVLVIRVADLHTDAGRAFALRYGAGFRTLLFFDADGNLVTSQTGVQESAVLRRVFARHAAGEL
ncbi:MAG: thioredoxin family protein [Spirochaetaceae bacterium]|nr:MAG: thioredoxin family protein [Spirochaetaceae bacterium]